MKMNSHLARCTLVSTLLALAMAGSASAESTSGKIKMKPVETRPMTASHVSDTPSSEVGLWKGNPEPSHFSLGGLAGLGIVDSTGGFSLIPTASTKISDHGFIGDINDSVSLEAAFGPLFSAGATVLFYSAHLRWDFQYDRNWIFYALGGVGGFNMPDSLGGKFELFPRFGVGFMYDFHLPVLLRFELSHEVIALGINVPLF